jgi:hypothetical protein
VKFHKNLLSESSHFMSTSLRSETKIIILKGEAFLFYKYLRDKELFAIVQSVGCTSGTFRCVFGIRSLRNKIESVKMVFPVTNVNESVDSVVETGRTMILDGAVVDNFVKDDELCMMVAVEEVT